MEPSLRSSMPFAAMNCPGIPGDSNLRVKHREHHERGPRAPPLLLASLFHLQHDQFKALAKAQALSLTAGLVH